MSVNLATKPATTPLSGYTEPSDKSMLYRLRATIAAPAASGEVRV